MFIHLRTIYQDSPAEELKLLKQNKALPVDAFIYESEVEDDAKPNHTPHSNETREHKKPVQIQNQNQLRIPLHAPDHSNERPLSFVNQGIESSASRSTDRRTDDDHTHDVNIEWMKFLLNMD
jgi:hypothetical protein